MTIYDHEIDCNCEMCNPPIKKRIYWRLCGWLQKYGCDSHVYCSWSDSDIRIPEYCRHKRNKFKANNNCMWRE
jgi:hypothetical protein